MGNSAKDVNEYFICFKLNAIEGKSFFTL